MTAIHRPSSPRRLSARGALRQSLVVLALVAGSVAVIPAGAQAVTGAPASATAQRQAASWKLWGPHSAPGKKATAQGRLRAIGIDPDLVQPVGTVQVRGKVTDRTLDDSGCAWAVFRITYRTGDGNLPFTHRSFRDCTASTPKSFRFSHRDVYQVELKVCSHRKATKPTLNCLYGGTWKVLYLAYP
ncbi:hypothetical protein [Streptosporangium roseum]|uniref:hypothetical protein n=1 Tax=Streptosporangium roseum TaxID=2001 RepID=UPI003327F1F3